MADPPAPPPTAAAAEAPKKAPSTGTDKIADIIKNVLSVQTVHVVESMSWDKLQILLHSLCDRLASQVSRMDKAEERLNKGDERLNKAEDFVKNMTEQLKLCQNALAASEADKAAEADKQVKSWSLLEERLKMIESNLGPLPNRVSVLEETTHSLEAQVHDVSTQMNQLDADLQELDADFTAKEARDSGFSTQELTEKIKQLEAQAEEFRQLMQQVTKAQTADLEAMQKAQRILRAELEAKPLAQSASGNEGLSELQKRLERKADVDTVEQLLRASTNTKEGLEALAKAIDEMKKALRKSSRFSVKMDETTLPASGDFVTEPTDAEIYDARCKKLEADLVTLGNKLSAKADRAAIDEMQFQFASGGGAEGGGGGDGAMKDLIAKKADREEVLEMIKTSKGNAGQVETLDSLYKELKEKLNTLGSSVTALAERSDLAVLLAKRAEQIAHPVALIQGGAHADDEEIQFVVNEHANRIMVYADMLLQMQVVLATKADNTALAALRELVEKGGKGNEMNETIKSHEKMLMKLLEDVGLLGKTVLVMSGHDNEYKAATVPATPIDNSCPISPTSEAASPPAPTPAPPPPPPPAVAPPPPPPPPPPLPPPAPAPALALAPEPAAPPVQEIADPSPSRPLSPASKGPGALGRKASRFGGPSRTPQRGSAIRITNVQEASQAVAQSKYRETLGVLEDVLNQRKLEPKENVETLKKLVLEVERMAIELDNNLELLDTLEQNKADKLELQALAKLVKELKAMDNAMVSGKPLLGFKCMSCNHDLEKLNPNRGPYIPTGVMPRSFLSMLSAERIFAPDKREGSPPRSPPRTPPCDRTGEFLKTSMSKDRKSISNLSSNSPYNHFNQPRRISSAGPKSPRSKVRSS